MDVNKLLKKYNIKKSPGSVLKDYAGMNYYAAKEIGFHPCPAKHTVLVDSNLESRWIKRTAKHEIIEAELMKRGYSYWDAHQVALRYEKEPFVSIRGKSLTPHLKRKQ